MAPIRVKLPAALKKCLRSPRDSEPPALQQAVVRGDHVFASNGSLLVALKAPGVPPGPLPAAVLGKEIDVTADAVQVIDGGAFGRAPGGSYPDFDRVLSDCSGRISVTLDAALLKTIADVLCASPRGRAVTLSLDPDNLLDPVVVTADPGDGVAVLMPCRRPNSDPGAEVAAARASWLEPGAS